MSSKEERDLPTLLVIAGKSEENWNILCSQYSTKFRVIQTTWDKISLNSYSDSKYPIISVLENDNSKEKKIINNIRPSLLLIRNLVISIGSRLDMVPDYRNILFGFYHANVPMINELSAIIAEYEKPIMYGRLRKIRDKYGEEIFPLIQQYYYPEYCQICITPPTPYVLKVSYPHAGYGKIRVKDNDDTEDLRSILALHKDYCAMEPLIDVDYELRIVFIAPNYYRVHKRRSMNWKVNFGMANEREDCEMEPRWKKWIDLIYENYPDMLIFDIDAIVDKNGKEYILEVNGSTQGFSPEHGQQDLEHLRDLVVRKMEVIMGEELLDKDNDTKSLFRDDIKDINKENNRINDENIKDTQIVNLKNLIDDYQRKINKYKTDNEELKDKFDIYRNYENGNINVIKLKNFIIIILGIFILILSYILYKK